MGDALIIRPVKGFSTVPPLAPGKWAEILDSENGNIPT